MKHQFGTIDSVAHLHDLDYLKNTGPFSKDSLHKQANKLPEIKNTKNLGSSPLKQMNIKRATESSMNNTFMRDTGDPTPVFSLKNS